MSKYLYNPIIIISLTYSNYLFLFLLIGIKKDILIGDLFLVNYNRIKVMTD